MLGKFEGSISGAIFRSSTFTASRKPAGKKDWDVRNKSKCLSALIGSEGLIKSN